MKKPQTKSLALFTTSVLPIKHSKAIKGGDDGDGTEDIVVVDIIAI